VGAPGGRTGPAEIIRDPPRCRACGRAGQKERSPSPSGSPSFTEILRVSSPRCSERASPARSLRPCQAWGLHEAPDFVVFSKKALLGGYYYKEAFQPPQGYRIFNTWMGDMTKLLLFRAVLEAAEREGLQARAVSTGAALMRTLEAARERRPRCWGSTLPPRPPAARRLNPPVFARGCECTAASCSFTPPSWHPHAEPAPPALRWLSSQPHLSRDAVHSHAVGAAPSRGAQLARRRHHHRL